MTFALYLASVAVLVILLSLLDVLVTWRAAR